MISLEKLEILTSLQKLPKNQREIWANYLLPKAIKSCPKSNKLSNLVTLIDGKSETHVPSIVEDWTSKPH